MKKSTVKISSIVEYQLPEFIRVEFPLLGEFLKEYYNYAEINFGPVDILRNISDYIKIDYLKQVKDTFYLYNNQINIVKVLKESALDNIQITTFENFDYIENDVIFIDNTNDSELDGKYFSISIISEENNIFELKETKKGFSNKKYVPLRSKNYLTEAIVDYEVGDKNIYLADKDTVYLPLGQELVFYDPFNTNQVLLTITGEGLDVGISLNFGTRFNGDRNEGLIKEVPKLFLGNSSNKNISNTSNEIIIYSEDGDRRSLPIKYGLIKIDDEIILYKDIDKNSVDLNIDGKSIKGIKLLQCVRGFSGIVSLTEKEDELTFEKSFSEFHSIGSEVFNLNSIFLKEFLRKIKYQVLPGFENRELDSELNESLFIKQGKDFYSSKGTESSFKILFSALYNQKVSVIRPSDFLISASNASYGVLRNLVVEIIEGDPEDLKNQTLYQDETSFIQPARGTVSFVERIERDYKSYYVISIDDGYERDINYRGTLFSQFTIHPKTIVTEKIEAGSTTINVDSTVSFPNSGLLEITTNSLAGKLTFSISYESKSNTQFYGCKSVGSISNAIDNEILAESIVFTDAYAYGFSSKNLNEKVKVRITGVLSNFIQNENTYLYEKGNKIRVQSLGKKSTNKKDNDWVYNIPTSYRIKNIILKDSQTGIYEMELYDKHNFHRSDTFYFNEDPSLQCYATKIISNTKINVQFVKNDITITDTSLTQIVNKYILNKTISKTNLLGNPELNKYSTNIQTSYLDKEDNLYVVSSSLPSYTDETGTPVELDIKDGSINGLFLFGKITSNGSPNTLVDKTFTDGTIDYSYITAFREGNNGLDIALKHGFYTGDQIVFRSLDPDKSPIPDGIYYIKDFRIEGDFYGFKLARSTSLILNPFNLPEFRECRCSIQFFEYSNVDVNSSSYLLPSQIAPRKLIKKISSPIKGQEKVKTNYGKIGIFKNGVEILNYKSRSSIFFGNIESIEVTSPGFGYDVINPPTLNVFDTAGTQVKYNANKSTPISNFSDSRPIKFGAVGGDVITYDGQGGQLIVVDGKTLNLGEKNLYINQIGGSILRINGLVATVGGEGGTQFSIGGEGGSDVRVGDRSVTIGDLGIGCISFPSVTGSLERMDIVYPGFNYIGKPQIYITGGNGIGALAEPVMESFSYQIEFPASLNNGLLDIQNNVIGFTTYHNFENYEEIIYYSASTNSVQGLENGSRYIISVEDSSKIKLYKSKNDAVSGINTVSIDGYSSGRHYLKSSKNKSKIGYISIVNSGSGYKNRKVSTLPENVNIISNTIFIKNHGYSDGELVVHFSSGSLIGGLQENTSYYVTKIDNNNIKLSETFNGSDKTNDFYFLTRQYVNLTSQGSGTHYFNYEPIKVEIKGFIGVSTSSGQDLNAKVNPIFRGQVDSIFVSESGNNYGSSNIVNYVKQPSIEIVKGVNAQAIPLITDGVIKEVLVLNSGKNYYSTPDIIVRGFGSGAVLVPEIQEGKITKINVLYGGNNYDRANTIIDIIDRGEGLKTSVKIKSWNINLLKRYELNSRLTNDEGFVFSEIGTDDLQYSHIYLSNTLRILFHSEENSLYYPDIDSDKPGNDAKHSPIVGWAYDGNPIYGPYGYENGLSGTIVPMESSYKLITSRVNGPSETVFPLGFFVEDYEYIDSSNNGSKYLDIHNGRYCKTPEYPNGVYAYFCTVDSSIRRQTTQTFIPKFPYIIGNLYESSPIEFNFDQKINQDSIDINSTSWYRNTTPYLLNNNDSYYSYIDQPNKIKEPISKIKYASYGQIEFVDVIVSGEDYKVGDKITFKNADVIGQDATASVSYIEGKSVTNIGVARSSFANVEFEKNISKIGFIGFTSIPHNYNDGDVVSVTTPIERITFEKIRVRSNNIVLTNTLTPVAQSGIVTYIEVSGNIKYPAIRENDIYKFTDEQNGDEYVKVLNINEQKSLIRIQRSVNGNSGLTTVYSGTILQEIPRKFEADLGIKTSYNFTTNYEYYFNAKESVGFGTDISSGITSVVYSNYSGISSITIPTRSIYLPNHGFETNQRLYFSGALVYNKLGMSQNTLLENTTVYCVKLNDDLIGLSTTKVGLGTTGNIIDLSNNSDPLLYFNPIINSSEISLRTFKSNILNAIVSQNIVTVSTGSTHGLLEGDTIDIKLKPKNELNVVVEYNDENRLMVLNPRTFLSSAVNTINNNITISAHKLLTGDKILYRAVNQNDESVSPIGGLTDNQIYYVVAIDRNTISLCNTLYESKSEFPNYISLSNSQPGKIYQINPQIIAFKNQTINFDLSHPSLSVSSGNSLVRTSSFTFDIYSDANFNYKYFSNGKTKNFDVTKIGSIGVTNTAKLKLYLSDNVPNNLFYKLTPILFENNLTSKLEILTDTEQPKNNRITCIESKYDGSYKIFDIVDNNPNEPPFSDATFKYQIPLDPEQDNYTNENCTIEYITNSLNSFGPISKVSLNNRGRYFYTLPKETKIESKIGTGAILGGNSTSIGQIKTVDITDIGFNYSSDLSIRPIAKLPTIFKVEPLYSIDKIRIDSTGINYLTSPNIVVIDRKTGKVIDDVVLRYNLGDNFVTIDQNTKNLSSVTPRLVPVNNSNAIPLLLNQQDIIILDLNNSAPAQEVVNGIDNALLDKNADDSEYNFPDSIQFSNLTTIQVFLKTEYSTIYNFPFELGDFVFIEDVITIADSQGLKSKGFNSESNGYAFYKVVRRDPNIGGAGASITLDFKGYVDPDVEDPEDSIYYKVDDFLSEAARIVPVKYFPKYTVTLLKNNFLENEFIRNEQDVLFGSGIVDQWDSANDYLKIGIFEDFNVGDTIIGETSKTKAILLNKINFDAFYNIDSTSIVNKGWGKDTGKLNFDLQRIHDSDYYQYFSYSLKSEVPIDKWDDPVATLNHTAGFKRFSNLEVISKQKDFSGISTNQNRGAVTPITDLISYASVNCNYDFDLVREISFSTNDILKSNQIIFNSRILQDYIESIDNRVLSIDDISKNFNPLPRETVYSIVSRNPSSKIRARKHFFYVQDRRFVNEKQMVLFTTLHDNTDVYTGQYGRVETYANLGYFESELVGANQNVAFFPTKYDFNNYIVDYVSFEMSDDPLEIEDIALGNVARIYNQTGILTSGILPGIGTAVVGIASTYRASKVLLLVGSATTTYYELNEISVIHDDKGNTELLEYGELTTRYMTNLNDRSVVGIASYSAKMGIGGTTLDIIMTPYQPLEDDYNIKTVTVSIANSSYSLVDNLGFDTGEAVSFEQVGIGTTIPSFIEITNYSTQYKCSYIFASIVGIKTDNVLPYNAGSENHGISDWYAFENGTATYSAIYPNTEIIEVPADGFANAIITTGSNPQRGTISITAGSRYYGTKPIHIIEPGNQHRIAPISYASTIFGHYIADRSSIGIPTETGISNFNIFALHTDSDVVVTMYDKDQTGIANTMGIGNTTGIGVTTITVKPGKSGILTTTTYDDWVFFTSTKPVIITTYYYDSADSTPVVDKGLLSPAISINNSTMTKYFTGLGVDRIRTAYDNPLSISDYNSVAAYNNETIIAVETDDGSGSDMKQGIPLEYLSNTYSYGETLSDYAIIAPYPNTTVDVSYWNGSSWVLGERHNLNASGIENPDIAYRSGTSGFGVSLTFFGNASELSGTAANFAGGANLWKFQGNNPFALFLNDSTDDETEMLGFSSSFVERQINKQYESKEFQLINDQRNSYITEYGKVVISNSATSGIGTIGIGTFSSKLDGSFTRLLFRPSPNTMFKVQGLQINVGRF
jgi:hypothetical protein